MQTRRFRRWTSLAVALALGALTLEAHAAATLLVLNGDGAGEGFNDPTPVAPIGGNPGTTIGQQRLIAVQQAVNVWGATLTSAVTIVVQTTFDPLVCPTQATGTPTLFYRNFAGAPRADTWFPAALANRNSGTDLSPATAEIRLTLNSSLGGASCQPGIGFYYGLDDNHGTQVDLVSVTLHEVAHGLGFHTTTNTVTGAFLSGFPSMFDVLAFDTSTNKAWVNMTNAERVTSARNARKVVWTGANAVGAVPAVLQTGVPRLVLAGPAAGTVAGDLAFGPAAFGAPLTPIAVTGQLMRVADQGDGFQPGCLPLDSLNALAVNGRIALLDEDPSAACSPVTQAGNAQSAGAIGVVIVSSSSLRPPAALAGSDPTITVPVVVIAPFDGAATSAAISRRSRTASGVTASLLFDATQYTGADPLGRPLLFASDPVQGIAHWDTTATPNQLMEPVVPGDVSHSVVPPSDLTWRALQDIGW